MNHKLNLFTGIISLTLTVFSSCHSPYKAGNLIALSYPVETTLKSELIQKYLDSLVQKDVYGVPEKWKHFDKLIDIDSINNRIIYFRSAPEEMYLLSFGGMFVLSDIYNPQLKMNDWVSERNLVSKDEKLRVMHRLKDEMLDVIEKMAKRNNLPDSLIYKQ